MRFGEGVGDGGAGAPKLQCCHPWCALPRRVQKLPHRLTVVKMLGPSSSTSMRHVSAAGDETRGRARGMPRRRCRPGPPRPARGRSSAGAMQPRMIGTVVGDVMTRWRIRSQIVCRYLFARSTAIASSRALPSRRNDRTPVGVAPIWLRSRSVCWRKSAWAIFRCAAAGV